MNNTFKVIIIGEKNTGKTSFIKALTNNYPFSDRYTPTIGCEVHPIKINTNLGNIKLNIWDIAGDPEFSLLRKGYFLNANMALLFFSNDEPNSVHNINKLIEEIRKNSGSIPIVIVQNKSDLHIETNKLNKDYISTSAKTKHNQLKVILECLKKLMNKEKIEILDFF